MGTGNGEYCIPLWDSTSSHLQITTKCPCQIILYVNHSTRSSQVDQISSTTFLGYPTIACLNCIVIHVAHRKECAGRPPISDSLRCEGHLFGCLNCDREGIRSPPTLGSVGCVAHLFVGRTGRPCNLPFYELLELYYNSNT